MYHTRETVLRPDWRLIVKAGAFALLLGACFAFIMGEEGFMAPLDTLTELAEGEGE